MGFKVSLKEPCKASSRFNCLGIRVIGVAGFGVV